MSTKLFIALLAMLLASSLLLVGCSALSPRPQALPDRLGQFPTEPLPLQGAVTLYWNRYQVPFIDAASDRDLAFVLGLVHAHLRGAQMAILKRVAQGRLAEMAGPPAVDIDRALRTFDLDRAAEASLALMPAESRLWVEAYVAGINHYHEVTPPAPELGLLGIEREPFRAEDVITIGRLAGIDVNWLEYLLLLQAQGAPEWTEIWSQRLQTGASATPSFVENPGLTQLSQLLTGLSRSGSNAVAVAPSRSADGAAMLANDPHLGFAVPNIWLLAGYRSPSYHLVGMMVPGLPFAGLGRNPDLAWGGTNMRAASSDLYDVAALDPELIQEEREAIDVRFWFDTEVVTRWTPLGPIISDRALIPNSEGQEIALRWVGHEASDEITAFLRANRARSGHDFRRAFEEYAVSSQNLLFADRHGEIGLVPAVRLPQRSYRQPPSLILDPKAPQNQWQGYLTATELPALLNPSNGFIASANNPPLVAETPIGFFFRQPERVDRLQALLAADDSIDFNDLVALQQDSYSPAAHRLAGELLALIDESESRASAAELVSEIEDWDGYYEASATGPVAFELTLFYLWESVLDEAQRELAYYGSWNYLSTYLLPELKEKDLTTQKAVIEKALTQAAERRQAFTDWGDFHRLRVQHPLAFVPLIGGRFIFDERPISGSRETVFKSDHKLTDQAHYSRYGSQSRHISLMSDLDSNYFVLMGGQDGWLGSENLTDQVPLWSAGDYLRLPLRLETVRAEFPYRMILEPGQPLRFETEEPSVP